MRKIAVYIMIILLSATFTAGCGKAKVKTQEGEGAVPVKAMKVSFRDLSRAIEYVGDIKGQDEAVVYPKVSGKIIEKVKDDGSPINKGDPIVYIDRDEVGLTFEKAPVESPLTGVVGRVYVEIGATVTPQTPVAMVANMENVTVDLNIPEKYLPEIILGQKAIITIDAYPDEEFIGKVTKISPILDIETRAAPIEITIDDRECHLQSGMFARVKLILKEHKSVPVILKEAIMGKEPNQYVYVIQDDKVAVRKIKLGIHEGPYFEAAEGLKDADLVVIMGQQKLRDGAPVTVETAEGE